RAEVVSMFVLWQRKCVFFRVSVEESGGEWHFTAEEGVTSAVCVCVCVCVWGGGWGCVCVCVWCGCGCVWVWGGVCERCWTEGGECCVFVCVCVCVCVYKVCVCRECVSVECVCVCVCGEC